MGAALTGLLRWLFPRREKPDTLIGEPEATGDLHRESRETAVSDAAVDAESTHDPDESEPVKADEAEAPLAPAVGRRVGMRDAVPLDSRERAARPIPSHHAERPAQTSRALASATEPAAMVNLTLLDAIGLVRSEGGDAIELEFIRRELERGSRDEAAAEELWQRAERAVSGRLRRLGRLPEGQTLTLRR